ncbi:MAG: hypothetical protein ACOYMB_03855 [Patescibacteria group bacterium]
MNIENGSNLFEKKPEHIPSLEDVQSVFNELTNKEYKEIRRREDAEGLYFLEINVQGESEEEVIEYSYMRKGSYPECKSLATEIFVTYYDGGMPISGTSAARCVDGVWKVIS